MTTDSVILRQSLDDPSAFAELFDRHARAIGGYAAKRVGSDAAQDVLSETFLVAFRRRASFDHSCESAKPWLFGIASRLVKKHAAREAAQWRAVVAAAGAGAGDTMGALHAAEDRADASAHLRALAPRLARLAARDRDTLLLYAWGDLTYEEVAAALGIPVGTVRSRLNRVRRRLGSPEQAGMAEQDGEGKLGGQVR